MKITKKSFKLTITFDKKDDVWYSGKFLSDGHFLIDLENLPALVECKFPTVEANGLFFTKTPFIIGSGSLGKGSDLFHPDYASMLKHDPEYSPAVRTDLLIDLGGGFGYYRLYQMNNLKITALAEKYSILAEEFGVLQAWSKNGITLVFSDGIPVIGIMPATTEGNRLVEAMEIPLPENVYTEGEI